MEGFVFVTNACNARCSFCFYRRELTLEKGRVSVVRVEDFRRFCELVSVNGGRTVTLVGGEPLLVDDLLLAQYVDVARDHGLKIYLETNCSLLHRHNREILREFDGLFGSIDYVEQRHEEIRGIRNALSNATEWLNAEPNFSITSVFLGDNLDDIGYLAGLHAKLGKPYYVKTVKPDPAGLKQTWQDLHALYDMVATIMLINGDPRIRVSDDPGFWSYMEARYSEIPGLLEELVIDKTCGMGVGHVAMTHDLRVRGCVYDESGLSDLGRLDRLTESRLRHLVNELREKKVVRHGGCVKCPVKGCTGCAINQDPARTCPAFRLLRGYLTAIKGRPDMPGFRATSLRWPLDES